MLIIARLNKAGRKGVTLVEVMISLVILLIVFMGLIQASLLTIQSNMTNVLRDEAARITSDQMSTLRSATFTDMDGDGTDDVYPLNFTANTTRDIRNVTDFPFGVAINVITLDANHKQMTVTTTWTWQGENFTHSIVTTRGL